jgi:hypothetical protein
MADKNRTDDSKTTEVQEQKLDDGYSAPGDSRTDDAPLHLNEPGGDFSNLESIGADDPTLPLDNTPAGQALGHGDGRDMSQTEGIEEIRKDEDPSQKD